MRMWGVCVVCVLRHVFISLMVLRVMLHCDFSCRHHITSHWHTIYFDLSAHSHCMSSSCRTNAIHHDCCCAKSVTMMLILTTILIHLLVSTNSGEKYLPLHFFHSQYSCKTSQTLYISVSSYLIFSRFSLVHGDNKSFNMTFAQSFVVELWARRWFSVYCWRRQRGNHLFKNTHTWEKCTDRARCNHSLV